MNYNLTKPCKHCPFRTDVAPFLNRARAREIVAGLARGEFACHKTVDYSGDDGEGQCRDKSEHCAGALIMLEHVNQPSQMMRIMERTNGYDRTKLDMSAPVFQSPNDFIKEQPR